jgi:hypothetical protein
MSATEAQLITFAIWATLLLFAAWQVGALGVTGLQYRRAVAYAKRAGLPGDRPEPAFIRRLVRRERFVLTGVALGLLGVQLTGGSFALAWVGLAAGAVADQLAAPPLPEDVPRVAHTTGTDVTDYVPGWLLSVVAAAAGIAPVLGLLWLVAPRDVDMPGIRTSGALVAGWVALAVAGLAASLLLARFLVRRPQRALSADDLAADDALRAQAVRDALLLSAAVSIAIAFQLSLALHDSDVVGWARVVGGWTPVVLVLGVIALGVVHESAHGPRYWRSRLVPA